IETELLELQKTATSKTDLERITSRIEALKRLLVRQHPLLSRQPLCFVERQQYLKDHHNTATLFQKGEINAGSFRGGGALKALDTQTGQCRTILKTDTGVIRDPEMSFDGRRVLFSMRRDKDDDYHIYEIGSDGSELRQLTRLSGISDIDPLYLPDGGIVFSSTREPKYCMCNRHIMCNLFRMDGDGVNIRQIGKSTLFEGHSSLLSDGRILYDRWEYVDRNFGDAQGLWTVNPDGTNHAVYWGNNTASPGGVLEGRQIPGTQQIVCTLGSCHDRPWGAIGIIDRAVGIDGPKPILRTWPATAHKLAGTGNYDQFKRVSPKYEDPYPLSEKYFLCARTVGDGDRTAIFLVDVFGNDLLVHESDTGCFDPMPLAPRAKPPIIPARRNYRNQDGFLYVADVHEGTHMAGVKRGSAAFLRVIESPEKRYWSSASWGGQGVHCPAMNWHSFENKRILGTVPVAADGSAYVQVPADRFVFFQLLDKRGMMIQSMRSGTMVQSGETTGCIGCHEPRLAAPRPGKRHALRAAEQPPATLDGWYGAPRVISFQKEIQPIFDRNCVSCHDFGKPAGKKLLLAGDREITFCASYVDLWRTKAIRCVGGGPAAVQQAYSWGSHASKLIKVLDKGHNNVKLSPEERARLVTWIDLNAPYYPTYASAYPNNLTGRCPLNKAQLAQLSALTNTNFSALARHSKKQRVTLSFDRPELSPCLLPLGENPTAHAQALAVIRTGQAALQARPRADMDDFVPCQKDAERLCKYAASQAREKANRQAVIAGGKRYDTDSVPVED
ncbi:MAG: hypothetical protein KAI66_01985, partial [Lentisphaeria bacterium]|nr:hypothetical protein [Lentisphaeria bacterium]